MNQTYGFKPTVPDYKGEGIAIWTKLDKDGRQFFAVKVLNSINLRAFKNIPKLKPE